MEAKIDVLAALEAKATQTSLESLARSGKKNVRVIRARDVAFMVQEAVQRAFASSEWIGPDKVAELNANAQREFAELEREREAEHRRAAEQAGRLERLEHEKKLCEQELDTHRRRAEELERDVHRLRARVAELEARPAGEPQRPASGDTAAAMMMMRMMDELHSLRSQSPAAGLMPAQPAPAGSVESLLDKKLAAIVGSLDERLDKIGRKMGVSAAIETEAPDFQGLVAKTVAESAQMESNVEDVGVEKRDSSGIAANLERIKQLRKKG